MPTAELERTEAEVPDWVDKTYPDQTYDLTVYEGGGSSVENVSLTRDEYITLKEHLAAMRGYRAPSLKEAQHKMIDSDAKTALEYDFTDSKQAAMNLQIARDMYRLAPTLVLVESKAFDAELAKIADGR